MGEPGNATEVLLLFIAEFAHYFVPINQEPFSALYKLEDVVQEPLSQERSDMETLLKTLQELRLLAPTHFHFDIYSLQYEIIRARLAKCTKDFLNVAKTKKRKPREPNPQKGATWPSSSERPAKRPKTSEQAAEATKAVTFGALRRGTWQIGDNSAPATPAPATKETAASETSASPATLFSPAQASVAQSMESQLAQAMLEVQRLQQQQAVASQQQNEAAPPSSASIPSTPNSEQGGVNTVVETEEK
jgi:hypothetical protein